MPTKGRVLRVRLTDEEYQLLRAFAESHATIILALFPFFIGAMSQSDEQKKTTTESLAAATKP